MHVGFRILADDVDVTANFKDRLVAMTINDEAGMKSDTAEITIDDRDYAVALPPPGAKLQIALGFVGELVEMGVFVVDEVTGQVAPDQMTITAKAADMASDIRARKTREWSNVTIKTIVERIAADHGLEARIGDTLKSATYDYLAQTSESDLNFLTRLARDLDATAKPAGGYLVFVKRGEGKAADGAELPMFNVDKSQMQSCTWTLAERGRYASVTAEWGERGAGEVKKVTAGEGSPVLSLRHRYPSQSEAQRAASSALEKAGRESGKISVGLGGFWGDLTAEAKVNLTGIKPELRGEWLLTRVQHRLSRSLLTTFDAERNNGENQ